MSATPFTISDKTLNMVCASLRNRQVVDFVRASLKTGYHEFFTEQAEQVDDMLDEAFESLTGSQRDRVNPAGLLHATSNLLEHTYRKHDGSFWFNQKYHQYKTQTKPEIDFRQLAGLISGNSVLDYGCGSGYLAARLAKAGYNVFTTDVMDYRYAEAKHLPFIPMSSPTDIPLPNLPIDTALVHTVLHHINSDNLQPVLRRLATIAPHLLIKEDTYDLPEALEGLNERIADQPLLWAFVRLPRDAQYQVLVLIDFFANAIAQGLPQMNMPFEFKTMSEWERILELCGFKVLKLLVTGFEPGRMHKSCHVCILCKQFT
jgi:SAM-dependent methyltransferase